MDGLGSASPPVAPTATTGEGRHPCTWPRTFWFKPLSAFGLLDLTTFISSSPELAMPSTLAPNRLSASSRRALSREARPPWVGEVTLSQELRTARLPRPHVLVGYQWSHTGLRPGRKTSHNRYIRSFVSHPPQIRACTSRAPGSSLMTSLRFATGCGPLAVWVSRSVAPVEGSPTRGSRHRGGAARASVARSVSLPPGRIFGAAVLFSCNARLIWHDQS